MKRPDLGSFHWAESKTTDKFSKIFLEKKNCFGCFTSTNLYIVSESQKVHLFSLTLRISCMQIQCANLTNWRMQFESLNFLEIRFPKTKKWDFHSRPFLVSFQKKKGVLLIPTFFTPSLHRLWFNCFFPRPPSLH